MKIRNKIRRKNRNTFRRKNSNGIRRTNRNNILLGERLELASEGSASEFLGAGGP